MRKSRLKKQRAWGEEERKGDTGGWDSLNDSVLPFTFHTRTLLAPLGGRRQGGGVEEACVLCVVLLKGERWADTFWRCYYYTFTLFWAHRGTKERHTHKVCTHRQHISTYCTPADTHTYKRICGRSHTLLKVHFAKSKSCIYFTHSDETLRYCCIGIKSSVMFVRCFPFLMIC